MQKAIINKASRLPANRPKKKSSGLNANRQPASTGAKIVNLAGRQPLSR